MHKRRSPFHGWVSRAGARVDEAVLKALGLAVTRSGPRRPPREAREILERLAAEYDRLEHYAQPDTFFVPPPTPEPLAVLRQDIPGGQVVDLTFPSAYQPHLPSYREEFFRQAENLTAHARWYRSLRPRTTLICIHGMGTGAYAIEERVFAARGWFRAGLDVVLFQLPLHGNRRPRSARGRGPLLPSPHVVRTNESLGQAISDLRALLRLLRERDVPACGVMGMSLGAYTAALLASVEDELAFCVPMIPAVSLSDLMWDHGKGMPSRKRAEEAGVTRDLLDRVFRVHSPLSRPPRIPHERRFLIAGRGDRITPPEQAEALWEHWGRPPIHWFDGGHLVQVGRRRALRALKAWLDGHGLLEGRSLQSAG